MTERDDGFTLVEVMVVTILLGLVSLVIGFAITTVLRVTPTAESNVSDARSVQGLTILFPGDVASAVASGANITPNPSALMCSGSETGPGLNIIELQWTVAEPSSTTYVAAYRLEPRGDAQRVRRYECSDATGPFNDTTARGVTAELANVATVVATPSFDRIELGLQALDGTPINIEATPRSPSATLPTTTTAATVPPPVACAVTFDSPTYGPVGRVASGLLIEKLDAEVEPDFTISGDTCGTLTIEYFTGFENKSREILWFGGTGTATIPKGDFTIDTPKWTAATHTIEVYNNGAPLTVASTATVEVLP